jgi:hypothetical protein
LETNVESGGIGPAPIAHHRHALGLHVQNVMYLFEVRASDRLKKPVILLLRENKETYSKYRTGRCAVPGYDLQYFQLVITGHTLGSFLHL